jgi:hypothetical protein
MSEKLVGGGFEVRQSFDGKSIRESDHGSGGLISRQGELQSAVVHQSFDNAADDGSEPGVALGKLCSALGDRTA